MQSDSKYQCVTQRVVFNGVGNRLNKVFATSQKRSRVFIARSVADQVERCQSRLPARSDKNERRVVWRVFFDCSVTRFIHSSHPTFRREKTRLS